MKSKCSKDLYINFLRVTTSKYNASALSEVSPESLSHDSVSRWLRDNKIQPKDIWNKTKKRIMDDKGNLLEGMQGCLIVDDSTIGKKRTRKADIVSYQYSGVEHKPIPGIGMLNMVWSLNKDDSEYYPVDYRIYHPKGDNKTKNEHFRDCITLSVYRGLIPDKSTRR